MLFNAVIKTFSCLITFLIVLLPSTPSTELAFSGFLTILNIGIELFGVTTFSVIISNIACWSIFHMGWAIFMWLINKIPGIN